MMNFYKNVIEHKGKLLVRGIRDGKDFKEKIDFGPTLYGLTQEHSVYKTLEGQYLKPIEFKDIMSARKFKKEVATSNSPIFGLERYHYQYIGSEYPEDIQWSKEHIKFATDYSTKIPSTNGFHPETAEGINGQYPSSEKSKSNEHTLKSLSEGQRKKKNKKGPKKSE